MITETFQTQHMVDDIVTREQAFEIFRRRFPSARVSVFANCMVYKCASGYAKKCAGQAERLIRSLSLPLIAKATTFHTQDSFIINYVS